MTNWAEIRNDYIDETDSDKGVLVMYIDAWITGDDDEEGKSIATIHAEKGKEGITVNVTYKDEKARFDAQAQELIQEGILVLENSYQ